MSKLIPESSSAMAAIRSFAADDGGATAVEYGLLAALLSVAIIVSLFGMGNGLRTLVFDNLTAALAGK